MLHRRTFLELSVLAVAELAFQRVVRAQTYPERPITIVVRGFGAVIHVNE